MSGVLVPTGDATTALHPFDRMECALGRKSLRMFRVVDFSVEAPVPYGGSVAMASTFLTGSWRASPRTSPNGSLPKCFRFLLDPLVIRLSASTPTTSQTKRLASRRMPPTPQNGSKKVDPGTAWDMFTIERASLGTIVLGWKDGLILGLRLATNTSGRRCAIRPR